MIFHYNCWHEHTLVTCRLMCSLFIYYEFWHQVATWYSPKYRYSVFRFFVDFCPEWITEPFCSEKPQQAQKWHFVLDTCAPTSLTTHHHIWASFFCNMASRRSPTEPNMDEDERKGEKFKRVEQKRMSNVLVFLGFFSLIFLAAIIKVKHNINRYTPRSLRKSSGKNSDQVGPKVYPSSTFLPPNSIYRLSVENGKGQMMSLEKFAGMVTLVVNVASHWGKTQLSYEQMSQLQQRFGAKGFSVRSWVNTYFFAEKYIFLTTALLYRYVKLILVGLGIPNQRFSSGALWKWFHSVFCQRTFPASHVSCAWNLFSQGEPCLSIHESTNARNYHCMEFL